MTSEGWLRETFLHISDLKQNPTLADTLRNLTFEATYRVVKLLLHYLAVFQEFSLLVLESIGPILVVRKKLGLLLLPDLQGGYRRRTLVDDRRWCLLDDRRRSRLLLTCFGSFQVTFLCSRRIRCHGQSRVLELQK